MAWSINEEESDKFLYSWNRRPCKIKSKARKFISECILILHDLDRDKGLTSEFHGYKTATLAYKYLKDCFTTNYLILCLLYGLNSLLQFK